MSNSSESIDNKGTLAKNIYTENIYTIISIYIYIRDTYIIGFCTRNTYIKSIYISSTFVIYTCIKNTNTKKTSIKAAYIKDEILQLILVVKVVDIPYIYMRAYIYIKIYLLIDIHI